MAEMIPGEPRANTASSAERKIFGLIQRDLGNDWTAFHSVGIANHRRKPWAELDFVLVGPPGVFCLEVKGGRIARKNGQYHYTDRNGNTVVKDQGPFEQVAPAAAALRNYLVSKLPAVRDVAVAYGVVTPDIPFDLTGPDIEPQVVYDESDAQARFSVYIKRLAAFWHDRLNRQVGREPCAVSNNVRKAICDEIRGDFDLRPSLRTRVGLVNDELLALTRDQYKILDGLRDNERALIRGGAGSGKTLLAVEEASRKASEGKRVFLGCYTKNLALFLKEAVKKSPLIEVYHLHGFMHTMVKEANLLHRLPPAEADDLFTLFYPELCAEALIALDRWHSFDVLILDEAQDLLMGNYTEVLDCLLKDGLDGGHWRFFLDPHQDIFRALSPEGLKRISQAQPARFRLNVNCRNSKRIAVAAQILSNLCWEETLHVEGPEVEQEWYSDEAEQQRKITNCINRFLSGGMDPSEIIILSPRTLENSCLKKGLIRMSLPLVEYSFDKGARKKCIQFATVHSFKGLESDVVVLVDVQDLSNADSLLTLYVGATRAKAKLSVFLDRRLEARYRDLAAEYGERLMEQFV